MGYKGDDRYEQDQLWQDGQGTPRRSPGYGSPAVPPQFQQGAPPRQDGTHGYAQQGSWQQPQFQPAAQPPPYQYRPYQYQQPPPQYAPAPRQRRPHMARNVFLGIAGGAALVIAVAVAASSGGHSVQTSGSTAGSAAGDRNAAKTATVGSAITLTGNGSGEQMSVTVTKVITTARPADEFSSASSGDRLYAVQFRLKDTGSAAYSDAPSNGAAVTDSAGQSYNAQIAGNAAGCQSFSSPENIAAGSSGLGCIVFEVPAKAKVTQVQFTLDSGMGPDTGQWDVG